MTTFLLLERPYSSSSSSSSSYAPLLPRLLGYPSKHMQMPHNQVILRNPLLFVVHRLLFLFVILLFDSLLLLLGSWLLLLILFNKRNYRLFFHRSFLFLLGDLSLLGLGNGSGGSFSGGSDHVGGGLFTADELLSNNHPRGSGSGSDRSFDSGCLILYGSSFHSSNMRYSKLCIIGGKCESHVLTNTGEALNLNTPAEIRPISGLFPSQTRQITKTAGFSPHKEKVMTKNLATQEREMTPRLFSTNRFTIS